MNKKIAGFLAGGLVLVLGAQAHALSVNGAAGLTATVSTTAQMQAEMSGSSSSASGSMNMDMGSGSLQAQVSAGMVNASSDDAVISLQGNSIGMIQSNTDVQAYDSLVVKARPAVSSVNVNSDNSIDIGYAQPAKFLGIFSTSLSGNVHVDAQGNTTVHMPWYAFLYSKDTTGVKTSVATAVQQSGARFNEQADAMTMAQDNARVINAATAAIQAQASASVSATGTVSTY